MVIFLPLQTSLSSSRGVRDWLAASTTSASETLQQTETNINQKPEKLISNVIHDDHIHHHPREIQDSTESHARELKDSTDIEQDSIGTSANGQKPDLTSEQKPTLKGEKYPKPFSSDSEKISDLPEQRSFSPLKISLSHSSSTPVSSAKPPLSPPPAPTISNAQKPAFISIRYTF